MSCPVCAVPLVMSERQSVEIDYCPQCRGVWLDRGELDKIIERSRQELAQAASAPSQPTGVAPAQPAFRPAPDQGRPQEYVRRRDDDDDHYRGYPKRRKSFLDELFD